MEDEPMMRMSTDEKDVDLKSKKTVVTEDKSSFTFTNISACFIISLLLAVSLGTIQFGYMIGSWNAASAAYGKRDGWDDEE